MSETIKVIKGPWPSSMDMAVSGDFRIILAQPYALDEEDMKHIAEVCARHRLRMYGHSKGWYTPGTVCLEFTPLDQPS